MLLADSIQPKGRRECSEVADSTADAVIARRAQDAAIEATIRQRLSNLGYPQMQQLRIDVLHGRVAIAGQLSRYYLRQLAQTAVMQIPGVIGLTTDLSVIAPQIAFGEVDS